MNWQTATHQAIIATVKLHQPITVKAMCEALLPYHTKSVVTHAMYDLLEAKMLRRNEHGQLLLHEACDVLERKEE